MLRCLYERDAAIITCTSLGVRTAVMKFVAMRVLAFASTLIHRRHGFVRRSLRDGRGVGLGDEREEVLLDELAGCFEGWRGVGEFEVEGCDGAAGEAAGDDEVEVVEVWVDVEREAVHGDPAAYADAHCRDFGEFGGVVGGEEGSGGDPDAGGGGWGWVAEGGETEVRAGVDDGLLEEPHVVVDAEVEGVEVEDWVADDLAGAVVGDVAAAVGFAEFDAVLGEELWAGEDVAGGRSAAGTQCRPGA